jgi:hypothetical protein
MRHTKGIRKFMRYIVKALLVEIIVTELMNSLLKKKDLIITKEKRRKAFVRLL